ncbi:MAG: transposase [Opitutaceae bacterium]|nr:transposase [Cytophagales bacterium]
MNYKIDSLDEAKELLNQTIRLYNEERPHMSIGMLTPKIVHAHNLKTEKVWKT